METQNNTGAKVIGGLVLAVAAWGIYSVLANTDAPEKKSDGLGKIRKKKSFNKRRAPKLLVISTKNPLSNQLVKETGDTWNSIDFKGSAKKGGMIIHRKTGKRFTVVNEKEYSEMKNQK